MIADMDRSMAGVPFLQQTRLLIVSVVAFLETVMERSPSRTSLNCAKRAPPGRPPCCGLVAITDVYVCAVTPDNESRIGGA